MIVRLIVFVAIFFIGWWLYRQFIIFKQGQSQQGSKNKGPSKKEASQESMVRCAECQTFTPRSHAIHDQEARAFCSAEHLKAFNQKH
ncbi:PP0621 family protein [Marinomonas sp. FW-1]|uniref:PP0621 family protein n=1 Tax=Marinomonas sp. FW-1 TaxID=2071621 RepID=UPI0010C01D04|nr:PP0621 family protein [Marinomonas sp. FW-1]